MNGHITSYFTYYTLRVFLFRPTIGQPRTASSPPLRSSPPPGRCLSNLDPLWTPCGTPLDPSSPPLRSSPPPGRCLSSLDPLWTPSRPPLEPLLTPSGPILTSTPLFSASLKVSSARRVRPPLSSALMSAPKVPRLGATPVVRISVNKCSASSARSARSKPSSRTLYAPAAT
eukprot:1177521-Prorocentrum_minimum.AAC.2